MGLSHDSHNETSGTYEYLGLQVRVPHASKALAPSTSVKNLYKASTRRHSRFRIKFSNYLEYPSINDPSGTASSSGEREWGRRSQVNATRNKLYGTS